MATAPGNSRPLGLLGRIPPELFLIITSHLEIRELRPLMETSTGINALTAPAFYHKIYTKENTHYDIAGIVDLLKRRPGIRHLIRFLVIDELDEGAYRELLEFEMPNLQSIILQHEGEIKKPISSERKQELNALICSKPKINNFTLNVMHDPFSENTENRTLYRTPSEDAIFFHHPTLTRIRLSYLDLSAFDDPSIEPFPFEMLQEVHIEICDLNLEVLKKMLLPAKSIQMFRFHHEVRLPFAPEDFFPLLLPCKESLKVLKLLWRRLDVPQTTGMHFADFKAMKQFMVDPRLLLGPYTAESDMHQLIRERVPPNLKMLLLDNIVPPQPTPEGYGVVVSDANKKLLRTAIEDKKELLPHLRFLFFYDLESMAEPTELYPLAKAQKISISSLYMQDDPSPPIGWLDSPWVKGDGPGPEHDKWGSDDSEDDGGGNEGDGEARGEDGDQGGGEGGGEGGGDNLG